MMLVESSMLNELINSEICWCEMNGGAFDIIIRLSGLIRRLAFIIYCYTYVFLREKGRPFLCRLPYFEKFANSIEYLTDQFCDILYSLT